MKELSNIPIEFAVRWAQINAKVYPESRYIITLRNKGIKTLDEVFSDHLKECKKLTELRDFFVKHIDEIERDYVTSEVLTVIPAAECDTMAETLREFAASYAAILEDRSEKGSRQAELFRKYYICPELPVRGLFSREDLALLTGLTPERVRQILCESTDDTRRILLGETVGKVAAHPVLVDWFRGVDAKVGEVISISMLRTIAGCPDIDPFTERLLCDVLQLTVSRDKNTEPMACRGNFRSFSREIGKVTRFFREAGIPVSGDEFTLFLRRTFKDATVRDQLRDYVMTSGQYEVTMQEGRVKTVALRWEYLDVIGAEIARILYDNEVFSNETAWHRRDIAAAYNKLAALHRIAPMAENAPFRHPMIIACGKSGYYRIGGPMDKFTDGLTFAREYVIRKGSSATLAEFRDLCASQGYTHIYGERSIDSFFFIANKPYAGKHRSVAPDFRVLDAIVDILKENGGVMRVTQLQTEIAKGLGKKISYRRFVSLISDGESEGRFRTDRIGRKNVVVRLIESKDLDAETEKAF